MPAPLDDKTNSELIAILKDANQQILWASAVSEFEGRINAAGVGNLTELPSGSPPG